MTETCSNRMSTTGGEGGSALSALAYSSFGNPAAVGTVMRIERLVFTITESVKNCDGYGGAEFWRGPSRRAPHREVRQWNCYDGLEWCR